MWNPTIQPLITWYAKMCIVKHVLKCKLTCKIDLLWKYHKGTCGAKTDPRQWMHYVQWTKSKPLHFHEARSTNQSKHPNKINIPVLKKKKQQISESNNIQKCQKPKEDPYSQTAASKYHMHERTFNQAIRGSISHKYQVLWLSTESPSK